MGNLTRNGKRYQLEKNLDNRLLDDVVFDIKTPICGIIEQRMDRGQVYFLSMWYGLGVMVMEGDILY
jgi:hypothetical protein